MSATVLNNISEMGLLRNSKSVVMPLIAIKPWLTMQLPVWDVPKA